MAGLIGAYDPDWKKSRDSNDATDLDAAAIFDQIVPELKGEVSMMERPSDVRVLLRTADLQGLEYEFPNHGHPDNELSTVAFDGQNAIVIMPEGATPHRQLFSARQIVDKFNSLGLQAVTPEFMENHVVKKDGLCRKFAAQAYGPAPFEAQTARFVECSIPGANGGFETIKPVIEPGYAMGMRAPTKEMAFLIVYTGLNKLHIKAGEIAASLLATLEDSIPASLKGKNTAVEQLDGISNLQKGVVLALDSATNSPKPIRLGTAREIFDLNRMNVVYVNEQGKVIGQYLNLTPQP